jgi:hypothetical protein
MHYIFYFREEQHNKYKCFHTKKLGLKPLGNTITQLSLLNKIFKQVNVSSTEPDSSTTRAFECTKFRHPRFLFTVLSR